MSVTHELRFAFDNTYERELEGLYQSWRATQAPSPELLLLNDALAAELGLDAEALRSADGVAVLVGNTVPEGTEPLAQAYSGHQFGGFVPSLGDGRALLLGEILDVHGNRRDLHLKGSGRTPFSRGGDGLAAVGPMLREYVIGEAMHALGIPTTRGLAVVATGAQVARESMLPGAVLTRVAASHLRVGTFQFAAAHHGPELVARLADYAIARHHPEAAEAENRYLGLFERVVDVQASLIARWMLVGFVHGVMNTDNMTISGESIDYGPCAFMEAHDPATVFSSIDEGARYAYGNQPRIAQWNLARLAECLLPLIDDDPDTSIAKATAVLDGFAELYDTYRYAGLAVKLGLPQEDRALADDFLGLLREHRVDHTTGFRSLSTVLRGGEVPAGFEEWTTRWRAALAGSNGSDSLDPDSLDAVNPCYIPRNHLVEEALGAATAGDLEPVRRLVDVISRPFEERPGLESYAAPAPPDFGTYVTFCGT